MDPMTSKPDLSILIVSYNTREMTVACIESVIRETVRTGFEILFVDNGSEDGSREAVAERFGEQVVILPNRQNLGFAAANNLAAQSARADCLLLLNPDTLILDGAVDKAYGYFKDSPRGGGGGGANLFCRHVAELQFLPRPAHALEHVLQRQRPGQGVSPKPVSESGAARCLEA